MIVRDRIWLWCHEADSHRGLGPGLGPSRITPVETVAATAWAWIFFSERPSARTVVGGVIVLGAVLYGTVGGSASARRHERHALAEQ